MERGEILEELRQEGQVDSTGRFTLDAARAREKMKRYQLPDPHHYVLRVVQAAVASGASRIDLEVDADDCWIRFDARPPGPAELAGLFDNLFRSARDPASRALRALAIGLNSALALDPAWIRLDSQDGAEGWSLFVEAAGQRVEAWPGAPGRASGVHIHVRQRHSWRVLGRFLRGFVALHPEARVAHEHCRWCPVPVRVNGKVANAGFLGGMADVGEALLRREIEGKGYRALVALPTRPEQRSSLEIVVDGVSLETRTLDLGPLSVRGVVFASELTCNISQSGVVLDEAWRSLLHDLRRRLRRLVVELARRLPEQPALGPHLLQAVARQGLRADQDWRHWKEVKTSLLDAPVFPVTGGGTTSLRSLLVQYEETHWPPTAPLPRDLPAGASPLVVPAMQGDPALVLQAIFPQAGKAAPPREVPLERHPEESVRESTPRRAEAPTAPPQLVEPLLESLRAELRTLRERGHPELSENLLGSLRLGPVPRGNLWALEPGGGNPTLASNHALVRRLLASQPHPRALVVGLVSSFYSALRRANPSLRRKQEKAFHDRILDRILESPEVEGLPQQPV